MTLHCQAEMTVSACRVGVIGFGMVVAPHATRLFELWAATATADAVEQGRDPAVTGKAALEVHRLIDALLPSAREGRSVVP
jgi:hypothetical protein